MNHVDPKSHYTKNGKIHQFQLPSTSSFAKTPRGVDGNLIIAHLYLSFNLNTTPDSAISEKLLLQKSLCFKQSILNTTSHHDIISGKGHYHGLVEIDKVVASSVGTPRSQAIDRHIGKKNIYRQLILETLQ